MISKPGMMERLPGYSEKFYSIEDVQDDTYKAISKAYHAEDTKIHIIKSQTGAGKSHSYLQLMSENPDHRFLVSQAKQFIVAHVPLATLKLSEQLTSSTHI